jgi:hypothetical protein
MNFYDLIAKYKFQCNKKLENNRTQSNELTSEINETYQYIQYLNNKLHISPFIAGCTGVSFLFAALVVAAFGSLLWALFLVIGITLSGIGCHQEKKQEEFLMHKKEWYSYYSKLNSKLNSLRIEEQKIKKMINDVPTCCNYYMYLIDEISKEINIPININEVINSGCLLSTYIDKFYLGELEEFRKLSTSDKRYQENTNNIHRRIKEAKNNNNIIEEEKPQRRRRVNRQLEQNSLYYPLPPKRTI